MTVYRSAVRANQCSHRTRLKVGEVEDPIDVDRVTTCDIKEQQ
jgi:hypothetical protein